MSFRGWLPLVIVRVVIVFGAKPPIVEVLVVIHFDYCRNLVVLTNGCSVLARGLRQLSSRREVFKGTFV